MGLDGYTHTFPLVEKSPGYVPPHCLKYEDMPKAAETRALARQAWIGIHDTEDLRSHAHRAACNEARAGQRQL